ncbi:MAG: radical SAM protein [Armatimonadetes bacterium]|nr:radical SAM protein [Armatimonadota bacterium]
MSAGGGRDLREIHDRMIQNLRGFVVSWNLTRCCNLMCRHCYMDASPFPGRASSEELSTESCLSILDQIQEVAPEALLILSGGEALLRPDFRLIAERASSLGFWVVLGTNGIAVDEGLAARLRETGIRGAGLSLDSAVPERHDAFRGLSGAWGNTMKAIASVKKAGLPFLIHTTVHKGNAGEIPEVAEKAYSLGAQALQLFFLVPSGRGRFVTNITVEEHDGLSKALGQLRLRYSGKMLINAKCAPHLRRIFQEENPHDPDVRGFSGTGGCPAGTQYFAITPEGDVTPCPYLPLYGGNLRREPLSSIWNHSALFQEIRDRKSLTGTCGICEWKHACGGCRARAFGATEDHLAADPICSYRPGSSPKAPSASGGPEAYGQECSVSLAWTPGALARTKRIPAFVRGMVIKKLENMARDRGLAEVSETLMDEARERMTGHIPKSPP